MPPRELPRYIGPVGLMVFLVFVAALIGGFLWAAFSEPGFAWIIGPFAVVYGILVLRSQRRWKRLETDRREESICEFARALPTRQHDTRIVRAVYEELTSDRGISVRSSDRLEHDLGFLPEDLEDRVAAIARRAGRSLAVSEDNRLYGRVVTVADLVSFFEFQPKE